MSTRMGVVPIDFRREGDELVPVDVVLFSQVQDYCLKNLAEQPQIDGFAKTWAVVEYDGEQIVAVVGVAAYGGNVPDVPLWRVTGDNAQRATKMLYDRMNGFFADNGMRGKQVFLYLNEKETEAQRCPQWSESLSDVGAVPAQRLAVTVR